MHHSEVGLLDRLLAGMRIGIVQGVEVLHQSDHRITGLGERVLLCADSMSVSHSSDRQGRLTSETDPRAPVERQVFPSVFGVLFPALWPEGPGVFAPEVGAAVHGEHVVRYQLALAHVDGRSRVGASSDGEGGVSGRDAEVDRDWGLETENCECELS